MKSIRSTTLFALPSLLSALALACGSSDSPEDTAGVSATITGVPPQVACVEISVTGASSADQLFSVPPGQTETLSMSGLHGGAAIFTAFAYPSACSAVVSSSVATWLSAPTSATLTAGVVTAVSITLVPAAGAVVSVGFDGGVPLNDAGSVDDSGTSSSDSGSPSGADSGGVTPITGTLGPINLGAATIYSVFTPIFSQAGTLSAVTAQLTQIHDLGFNVVYLLPITPIGQAVNGHPSYDSPYCVHDYYAIDPKLGSAADLTSLVTTAHGLGMHVMLDQVLNHTAWDNALINAHPEYYVHSDGNPNNVNSIEEAFNFTDVAQLDYEAQNGLAAYITTMLEHWITTYDIDGFRFDTADNPYGDGRMIPTSFWGPMRTQLEALKPGFVMLGEEEDPGLALAPFDLDYNWHLQGLYGAGGLQQVATGGNAALLQQEWEWHQAGWPAGMKHMTLLQEWDLGEDLQMYGGAPNTMAAAAFNFTTDGVPLLFNGEEVGNDNSGVNTHTVIDWNSPNAAKFTPFYKSLLALRKGNTALQQGTVTWVNNSAAGHVVSYTRADAAGTFLVVINFSGGPITGTVAAPAASGWTDVSPTGSPGGTGHVAPPNVSLAAYDFAIFRAN